MSDKIQQARDVLGKWRENATDGIWQARVPERPYEEYRDIYSSAESAETVAWNADGDGALGVADAVLIVGTAGNPDFLDAIDGLLAAAIWTMTSAGVFYESTELIAAAIIAADERMTS